MSTEEVTVSLSRLALAKAIKTPDAGEEAEPWSKSIIFHQSHIDSQMRKSIINPSSQQNKRRPGQRQQQQPLLHKNQKQQKYPGGHMDRSRSDELHQQHSSNSRYNHHQQQQQHQQQYPSQIQQQQQFTQVNSKTNGNIGHTNTTITKSAGIKQGRNIIPSDDEEEEDDDEDEDDEDEDDQYKKEEIKINDTKKKAQNNLPQRKLSEVDSKHEIKVAQQSKVKGKARLQQPSDDEEEESEDDSEEDSEEDNDDEKESGGDRGSLENGHETSNTLATEEIQQTYARRMSTLRQLEQGTVDPRRRSRSLSDMGQFSLPLVAEMHEQDISPNTINAVEAWQNTIIESENIHGSSASDMGSSVLNSTEGGETIEEPIVSTNILPQSKADYRMSTLGEMDFYKYQQQQQQQMAFHNMQMQQAMQMAQFQQYQQAMQMQQQMMSNYDPRMMNRQSVSAMDLMMQMEQEKPSSRKKKPANGSNIPSNDGLLGRSSEKRHSVSLQGQMMSHNNNSGKRSTMARASKNDYNSRESNKNRNSSRPPSGMAMYYDNNRAGSSMGMADPRYYSQIGRSESPMPTLSMSTPLQPMMGQYVSPNSGRGGKSRQSQQPMMGMPPMMIPSKSTGGSSLQPSSRQSTNWGTNNRERIR